MSASVLPSLRSGTAEAHARLEANVQIERRVCEPARYVELLERFLGFYLPVERRLAQLDPFGNEGLDFQARRKTAWLEHDLKALGLSAGDLAELPQCEALPHLETPAHGWGCAYVLEGATLGGRQISALLRDGAVPEGARAFFGSYGPAVGEKWKEFVAALEAFAAKTGERGRAEIVAAAQETFASLEEWLSEGNIR